MSFHDVYDVPIHVVRTLAYPENRCLIIYWGLVHNA